MSKIILILLSFTFNFTFADPILPTDFSEIAKEPNGKNILRGKELLDQTFLKLPKNVKSRVNCSSCHLNSGTEANAGPFAGVVYRYPSFYSRDNKVESLKERINHCFERSMNGKALAENSPEMNDMISYMTWLSKPYKKDQVIDGIKMKHLVLEQKPDLKKGKAVYLAKCVACHQPNGEGLVTAKGDIVFPALWGSHAFNIGAGMARLYTAAGFVKAKMPWHSENTLTDEEAWNVAAYFTQQPRPDFANKKLDWPAGDKPKDARY